MTRKDHYVLGHSALEIKRLTVQARLIDPITRQFFSEAGIGVGMKVLDVGCGAGDVSFLLANLVGDTGMVHGVDTASTAIGEARRRANAKSLRNVTFDVGDPREMVFPQRFDAVVGRYVLMFQQNPATMVQKLAAHVRPNGLVAFHEGDWEAARSFPQAQTYDQCCRWIVEAVRSSGADPQMGQAAFYVRWRGAESAIDAIGVSYRRCQHFRWRREWRRSRWSAPRDRCRSYTDVASANRAAGTGRRDRNRCRYARDADARRDCHAREHHRRPLRDLCVGTVVGEQGRWRTFTPPRLFGFAWGGRPWRCARAERDSVKVLLGNGAGYARVGTLALRSGGVA